MPTAVLRAQAAGDQSSTTQQTTDPQVAELQKVADRWDDAVSGHDQYALELVLAPEYFEITDAGEVFNRDQVVSQMIAKDAPRYALTQKVIAVRMVGDVAVVNGTYDRVYQGSRLGRTKSKEEKGIFSQVYVRSRNSWACMNSQQTLIVGGVAKPGKKKEKNGANEKPMEQNLGFQFPGMHHNDPPSPQQ